MEDAAQGGPLDFEQRYRVGPSPAATTIERRVLGSDFGATGYTTLSQAKDLAGRLNLSPAVRMLDLGAGCGWPGLYLAKTTGCRVVSSDLYLEGVARARTRARDEGLVSLAPSFVSSAVFPGIRPRSFDVVVHSDLLC